MAIMFLHENRILHGDLKVRFVAQVSPQVKAASEFANAGACSLTTTTTGCCAPEVLAARSRPCTECVEETHAFLQEGSIGKLKQGVRPGRNLHACKCIHSASSKLGQAI